MAKNYTKQDIERILKSDIETPEVVNMQINRAFRQIEDVQKNARKRRTGFRYQAAAVIMGIMLLGTVTVGATGFFLWHPDVAEKFEADEVQQQELEAQKVTVPVSEKASCTNNGITITLEQSLMTEKYMYLYFKITAPEDMKLSENTFFRNNKLLLNGEPIEAGYCGGLPDLSEDGTDNVTYWEYFVEWYDKKDVNGQQMTAHFENMEESDKADFGPIIAEGVWDVIWTLDYKPSEQVFEVNQPIEKENIIVKEVTISPISIEVVYGWEKKDVEMTFIDENGEEAIGSEWEVPKLDAVSYRMKDGTLEEISTGGMCSSDFEDENTYVVSCGCDKVYTVEDIAGIVFMNYETEETYEIELNN